MVATIFETLFSNVQSDFRRVRGAADRRELAADRLLETVRGSFLQ